MTDWQLEEELRAALWREQARERVTFQLGLWASLAGDRAAYVAFRERWDPLEAYLVERELPDIASDDDPEFDPLGISENTNVGT